MPPSAAVPLSTDSTALLPAQACIPLPADRTALLPSLQWRGRGSQTGVGKEVWTGYSIIFPLWTSTRQHSAVGRLNTRCLDQVGSSWALDYVKYMVGTL